ncbi:MAG: hypothetical protein LBB16_00510 [Puniceicoccales bacterium]|jgi:hypothetical protein|nr:hypothetical protein [Puniceicoccales bacterium]
MEQVRGEAKAIFSEMAWEAAGGRPQDNQRNSVRSSQWTEVEKRAKGNTGPIRRSTTALYGGAGQEYLPKYCKNWPKKKQRF